MIIRVVDIIVGKLAVTLKTDQEHYIEIPMEDFKEIIDIVEKSNNSSQKTQGESTPS
jgi:hypothetical protein